MTREQATFYGEWFAVGGHGWEVSERRTAGDPKVDPLTTPPLPPLPPSRPVVVEVVLVVVVDGVARLAVTVSRWPT